MRKWCKNLLLGLLTMSLSIFLAVGCSEIDLDMGNGDGEKLDAVSQSTISASLQDNQLMVYWGAVQLATMYEVTFNGDTQAVYAPSTSVIFSNVQYTSGSLTISIVARAVGYQASAATTYTFTPGANLPGPQTLAAPTGLTVNNGTLSWNAVTNATSYTVSDGTRTASVSSNSIALAANGLTVPTTGSITYTVIAKAAGYNDSAAAQYTYTAGVTPPGPQTLAAPTGLAVNNGTLSWNAVANATSYTVSDGTHTVSVSTNSVALAANGLTVPTNGRITYTVIAKAAGYNDSTAVSFTYTYTPPQPQALATPTGLAVRNGTLSWTSVANATSYTVSDGTHTASTSTNSIALATNGLTVPTSGSITYTVIAKAAGYTDSAAAPFTYTYTPTQPTTLAIPTGLFVASGKLTWSPVANATSYTVSDGTTTKTVNTNEIALAANGFTVPDSGTKTYTVIAKATGYNDSPSASYTHTYSHTHTYDTTQWSKNETHHWRTATCGHSVIAEESLGWGVHDFGDGNTCSVCAYVREMQELGKYVYYGEYPQSLKAESVTVGNTADADGYYAGSDGARYAKVTAATTSMGNWDPYKFSNDEGIVNGNVYYFKVEPIKWRVLETKDGVAFLLCDIILDHSAYYNSQDSREIGGATVYPNNYAHSDIRTWLNGTFYSVAFSASEQQNIQTTTVDNSAATTGKSENTYACENTQDKIFLPSYKEVHNSAYGFETEGGNTDETRMFLLSDYARANGTYMMGYQPNTYGRGQWWLRSPIWDSSVDISIGTPSGAIGGTKVDSASVGVAPAMRVTASVLQSI